MTELFDREYLINTFPEVAENYPKVFDYDQWLEFKVSRSVERFDDSAGYEVQNQPGPILYVKASPGNGTQYRFHVISGDDVPGIPDDCMLIVMDPGHYAWKRTCHLRNLGVHPSYLMEKMDMGETDAVAMCVILNRLTTTKLG